MKIKKVNRTPAVGKTYLLYARVSPKGSTWNAEESSIALQIQQMKEYILRKDPQAKFIVKEDEFKSGKNLKRPGIQSVLDDLETDSPPWQTLVVWALDRLSRSLADAVPIFEKLRDAGCGFICIRQEYLSTEGAMARFTLNQTILIAQLEREMTSERVKSKMEWIASRGKIPAGKIPIGYRRKSDAKNEIEPDPKTVPIVQDIFRSYLAQAESIADLRRRYSKYLYSKNQMYRMLRNRLYIGEVEYDGKVYAGLHAPIIHRPLFDAVNAMLPGERRSPRPSRQIYKYLLTGLVYCHCGRKMVPYSVKKGGKDSDTRYFYYKCQDFLGCKYAVNAERLDAEVLKAVREIAIDDTYIEERYNGWLEEKAVGDEFNKKRLQEFDEQIADARGEMAQIDGLFLSGVVNASNADYWNEKLTAARNRAASLEAQRQEFSDSLMRHFEQCNLPSLLQELRKWATLLDDAEQEDDYLLKRNLLLTVIHSVKCVDRDGGIELEVMTKGNKWRSEWGLIITSTFRIQKGRVYRQLGTKKLLRRNQNNQNQRRNVGQNHRVDTISVL